MRCSTCAFTLLALAVGSAAHAQGLPSQVIPYSGFLELDGTAVTTAAPIDMTFYLYTATDAEDPVWDETHQVDVASGRFSVNLGSIEGLNGIVQAADELYLEIEVEDSLLAGRQQIGTVPFAWQATPGAEFIAGEMTATSVTVTTLTGEYITADVIEGDGAVPPGAVMAFALSSCPSGWLLADGTADTPDLRGRFIIGAGPSYAADSTGGTTEHRHRYGNQQDAGPSSADLAREHGGVGQRWFRHATVEGIDTFTVNTAHLPPYYALIYCIKQDATP